MNLWQSASSDGLNPFGGMKEEQNTIRSLSSSNSTGALSPTISMGLITEVDCFKAIKELGDAKFLLKKAVSDLSTGVSIDQIALKKAVASLQQVHAAQKVIVNDVCVRFKVIHPEFMNPSEQLLKERTLYWDWYKEQHLKVYGSSPEILDKGV